MSLLANSAVIGGEVDVGDIGHSLRFRRSSSASLTRAGITGGAAQQTFSFFVERGVLGVVTPIFESYYTSSNYLVVAFNAANQLSVLQAEYGATTINKITSAVFRDPNAWLHVVITFDLSQAVGSRTKIWVDGVSQTLTGTDSPGYNLWFTSSAYTPRIGYSAQSGTYADFYLARFCYVQGSAVTDASGFGYLNTEINEWVTKTQAQVKAVVDAGGANSFMLDFDNGTSLTTLGYDKSSKGNNWTLNNFSLTAGSAYDWMLDVPGNSYATLNPLAGVAGSLTDGNLYSLTADAGYSGPNATIGVSSGKWYWETTSGSGNGVCVLGIRNQLAPLGEFAGQNENSYGYYQAGQKFFSNTGTAYGAAWVASGVIGVAFDADAGKLTFYNNGVSQGEAFTGIALSGNVWFPCHTDGSSSTSGAGRTVDFFNFGQRPFTYTPPTGFKSLCQANLPADGTVIVSGSFTGNVSADGPCIWMNGTPKTLTINGNAVTFGTHADRLATGFKIRTASTSYNSTGTNTWTATIDSNLQNIFKYNNAEGNP